MRRPAWMDDPEVLWEQRREEREERQLEDEYARKWEASDTEEGSPA